MCDAYGTWGSAGIFGGHILKFIKKDRKSSWELGLMCRIKGGGEKKALRNNIKGLSLAESARVI